ncbi:Uncharacterised protein [Streptococcus pneumoniae]|nr:Uncharacterised protein [Streptococcus pneumoniae]
MDVPRVLQLLLLQTGDLYHEHRIYEPCFLCNILLVEGSDKLSLAYLCGRKYQKQLHW